MARDSWLKRLIWLRGSPAGGSGASYEKTVGPAPIISISDAKPKPAKSLIVGMEPIQDLHGYDSPWPAGGGKNLFNPSTATAGYLNNSGVAQPQSTTYYEYYSDYIPINGNTVSIGYFGYASEDSAWSAVAWYDSDKNFLSRNNTSTNPNTLSVPENASYAIAMMRTYNHGLDKCYFAYGNDLTFAPYSNICPIRGRTGVTVDHSGADTSDPQTYPVVFPALGKNLLDMSAVTHNAYNIGNIPNTLLPSTEYTYSINGVTENRYKLYLAKSGAPLNALVALSSDYLPSDSFSTFTTPEDMSEYPLLCLAGNNGAGNDPISDILPQCEIGASKTAYEPYTNTVYGGTVDVVSGLLTVTMAQIASYNGEALPGKWISDRDVYAEGTSPTTGAQVVYELATPQTYQLTPTQIQLLRGSNTLLSDGDTITLTYLGTTPPNLLGGGYNPPAEQDPEELTEPEATETDEPTKETPAEEGENNGE